MSVTRWRAVAAASFLVVLGMGAIGVWYGIALSNVTAALVGGFFFLRGEWMGDVLGEEAEREEDAADTATIDEEPTPSD